MCEIMFLVCVSSNESWPIYGEIKGAEYYAQPKLLVWVWLRLSLSLFELYNV